jgi:hypothetical protein
MLTYESIQIIERNRSYHACNDVEWEIRDLDSDELVMPSELTESDSISTQNLSLFDLSLYVRSVFAQILSICDEHMTDDSGRVILASLRESVAF